MNWKSKKLAFSFKILAMLDIVFAKRFRLESYNNEGRKSTTTFDKDEVINAKL